MLKEFCFHRQSEGRCMPRERKKAQMNNVLLRVPRSSCRSAFTVLLASPSCSLNLLSCRRPTGRGQTAPRGSHVGPRHDGANAGSGDRATHRLFPGSGPARCWPHPRRPWWPSPRRRSPLRWAAEAPPTFYLWPAPACPSDCLSCRKPKT